MDPFAQKPQSTFLIQIARLALRAPIVAVFLNVAFRLSGKDIVQSQQANYVIGFASAGLYGLGLLCALTALVSAFFSSTTGLVSRGIGGLLINGGILGIFAYLVLFHVPPGLYVKYAGTWANVSTADQAIETLELRADRQFHFNRRRFDLTATDLSGTWTLQNDAASQKLVLCLTPVRLPDGTANAQHKTIAMRVDRLTDDTLQVNTDRGSVTYLRKPAPPSAASPKPPLISREESYK
jgi:hypothetical protein